MGSIIAKNVITRKPGFLYYVDGKGNVCEAKMARGGKKKKTAKKVLSVKSRKVVNKKKEQELKTLKLLGNDLSVNS